jgi:hypothetical protein
MGWLQFGPILARCYDGTCLKVFLGLLNDFALMEFVDFDHILFRQILEALATEKQDLGPIL